MREQASDATSRLRLAQYVLDLQARELRTTDDRPVDIRPKALDVLLLLAEHAGRVVDKATLMERVWPGVVVGDDSLTQTVVEIGAPSVIASTRSCARSRAAATGCSRASHRPGPSPRACRLPCSRSLTTPLIQRVRAGLPC
jgi:hypothetical protein